MSGEKSFEVLEKIFEQKNKQDLKDIKGYTMKYGNIIENGNVIFVDNSPCTSSEIRKINHVIRFQHTGHIISLNCLENSYQTIQ